jgi:dihydroorotate dehydrogenase electron transfer subunit
MFQIKAKLIYNKKIRNNYFRCAMIAPKIARGVHPGQFVSIRLNDKLEPLLRRPFSIHRVSGSAIEIFYELVGEGSLILSRKKAGESLNIIGPLGNGFNLTPSAPGFKPVLVAGGMGVAPLLFLAEKLKAHQTLILLGAKTKAQILCEREFSGLGGQVKIATDDGSKGFKGKVTDLLKHLLFPPKAGPPLAETVNSQQSTIYACGPRPMLKEVSRISRDYNLAAEISLEEHMACGIGACLGCVVNTSEGFKRVCKEGPVFDAEEVIWQ